MNKAHVQPFVFLIVKRIFFVTALFLLQGKAFSQLTGTKTIPGTYATVTAAVTALNSSGVGAGGVIFNIAAGYTETITSTISITATGTSANPITFRKDPATSGANPKITAYTTGSATPVSTTQDGIWRLIGSDYVTIDGIDLADNNASNASSMEYGFALYRTSVTDGCQYNTIKNCTITLNKVNNDVGSAPSSDGSIGINVTNATATAATTALVITSAAGTNSNNKFYSNIITNCNTGISLIGYAAASPFTLADVSNDVGGSSLSTGNTITNFGGGGTLSTAVGIRTLAQYSINISYNTLNSNDGSGVNHATTLKGIWVNTAISAGVTISNNSVTVKGGGTTQTVTAIENVSGSTAASNTVSISNNSIVNCSYSTATTGALYGITNSGAPATLNINSNTFTGNTYGSTTGLFYCINNSGAATTAININSNIIGTSSLSAITFSAANAGNQVYINNTGGTAAAALSISSNNIQGIVHSIAGTGTATLISNTAATLSQAINSNLFTNLSVNTTGNLTFIANSVVLPATGIQNVNSNSISGTFTKGAGGTVTLFTNAATSTAGSVTNNNNNNFSNITVTGATIIAGWVNTDGGTSTKYIQNNTFSNWTAGTGAVTALSPNISGTVNATSGNVINSISSAGAVTGISTGAGNDFIYSNNIYGLTTTGAFGVIGISISSGTLKNVYKNKIYNLEASIAGGTSYGISVSGTTSGATAANIYNNLIADLRTPLASAADPIRGISVTSTKTSATIRLYNNTIYLNATSSGANFGASGIYHTASATSTTAQLILRNNSITNTSTPTGTGLTVAYRRSSTATANYNTTSNNNLFYAGAPGTTRVIYYDGTNKDQTIATYKTRLTPADAQSVTEDITAKFLSTTGSSATFLHIDATKRTQLESGGANISGYTDDYDAETRQGNTGYAGTGTAPDIGADEFEGIKFQALSGSYNVGTGQTYTSLTKADGLFSAINSVGLAGDVTVNVTSDLAEDGVNALFQWTETGAGNYDLTIQPNSATLRTISGNTTTGLIRFDGVDRVTIDGNFSGSGRYLTFRNTNTAGTTGTAFTFLNGATNNTIRYTTIEAYANATNGVLLFSTSAVGGNSSNLIEYNNFNGTVSSNTSNVCIYSAGTVANENTSNTISNNSIYNYRDRALDVTATGSTAWTISNNSFYNGDISGSINYAAATTLHTIRILGGGGYTISNNYIGGNAALALGTTAAYSSTLGTMSYQGILLTTVSGAATSYIKGNVIGKIALSLVPTATSGNAFIGIETNGFNINIGGSSAGEGNTIGSNTTNGSILVTTTTALATYKTTVRGISCNNSGGLVTGNQVGSFDINNIGTAPGPSTFIGIYVNNTTAPTQVNSNIVGSTGSGAATNSLRVLSSSTSTTTSLTGITIGASVTNAVQVNANIIQNVSHLSATASGNITAISNTSVTTSAITITNNVITANTISATAGSLYGISNSGTPTSISITGNTISSNATAGTSTSIYCIINTAVTPSLNVTSNVFTGNTTTSSAGLFYAVYNSSAVTTTLNINSNSIGNSTTGPITFNAVNSGAQVFIINSAGAATCALSISNNNFQGINYATAGTGTNTYISNSAATLSQAINSNSFTNLNVQTTGNITFITNSVAVGATGTQSVNSNSISGSFTKKAGGTITFLNSTATCIAGAVINISNNNFSNVTVSGATTITGLINTDAGSPTKSIQNNTFASWTGGTAAITVMSVNITGVDHSVSGNLINNITNGAAITGILTAAGTGNIYSNIINTLSATVAAAVTGISISTTGTTKNIYKNKIYDLQAATATGTVNGILVAGCTTVNIYNNIIGDLRTPAGSAADPVRAINITSTVVSSNINVYYNTIYLNATSTGTNFGTTGIYHTVSATATTASLTLINNSVTNLSTIKGTGLIVAYRRSGTSLSNYNTASNNNLWYSGAPSSTKLIFNDGTNSDQTLAAFKTRMSTRDAASVTEDISSKFLSTTGSSGVYLHISDAVSTLVESGGVNISGFTDDFDGQVRQGNAGYSGTGYAPDIGADEIFGIEIIAPVITYTILTNTTVTSNRTLSSVTITDASGINITSGTKPRIYYKRVTDANTYADNTSATNGWKYAETGGTTSPFSFVIDYSKLYGGTSVVAGSIQYFVVAQDIATSPNIAINSGIFNATPATVALTSAAFPITGSINSYNIPFAGSYNVGTGNVYTSLTKADGIFSGINTVGLIGNVTLTITSDLSEDGVTALSQWTEQGTGNYTMTIQPDATTLRTISGNVVSGLIRLNGADRVTIDGSNSGSGNYLAFSNTNTSGTTGTAFTFINGATNNTLRYCNVEAYTNTTNGVVLFSTTTGVGNSNNLIEYNNINGTVAANNSSVDIYSAGTVGNDNVSNTISNNNIYNYLYRGIDVAATGSSAFTISNNSFYNGDISTPLNYAAASTIHGIRVLGGAGYTITNNYIGGNAALASGTDATYSSTTGNVTVYGISLTTTSATPASNIKGNTINKIAVTPVPTAAALNVFTGIETLGSGINIGGTTTGDGNTIGTNNTNGAITVTTTTASTTYTSIIRGIDCNSSGGLIKGNQVGGIDIKNLGAAPAPTTFNGIYINNASASSQVTNNVIGSAGSGAIANSIRVRTTSTAANTIVTGISIGTATASVILLDNNTIQNIGPRSTTASGNFTGIDNTATSSSAVLTITNNIIKNVLNVTNSSSTTSIFTGISSGTPSIITGNTIDNFSLDVSGANAQVTGINVFGAFVHQLSSNTISNLTSTSQKANIVETGSSASSTVIGVLNAATVAGQEISSNTISHLAASTTAAVNTVVTGIGVTGTVSGNIFKNRMYGFTNTATGTNPGIAGLTANGGIFNAYNNAIKIDNPGNTNGVALYGIIHNAGVLWNYFYNTIDIEGSSSGTAVRTAAFIRPAEGALLLRNNVFVNTRSGTGTHYAISNPVASPSLTWTSTSADYNDIYSSTSTTVGEWGSGVSKTAAQWKAASGGSSTSVSRSVTFVSSVADLEPDAGSNCALNNAGTPITSPIAVNTDINGVARSATVPDIGAYEFSYTAFVPIAANSSPVCNGSAVNFSVDEGDAFTPTFSWTNPSSVLVSTTQNPSLVAIAGQYNVTVTDVNGCSVTAQTTVSLSARPTASIAGSSTICAGSNVVLTLTTTGSGTISGTLSSGDTFSGTAPTISVTLSPADTTSYYITDMDDANCTSIGSDIHDTLLVAVIHGEQWTGAVSTNWNTTGNWYCNSIPVTTTDVVIPGSLARYPIISSGTSAVSDLVIQTGAGITVSSAIFQISGSITNNGSVTASSGTIQLNGSTAQTIPAGLFAGNVVKDLTVSNTAGVTLGGGLSLTGVLTISAGNFTTGSYLTLKSNATGTARVAQITSVDATPIIGNVTVERYVPGRRKYRLITSSVTTSAGSTLSVGQEALSIWGNWQNQGNNSVGNVGNFITGGTTADGFDQQTSNASLFTYDDVNRQYVAYSSANSKNTKYTPLKAGKAYYMFVYGDRLNSITSSTPNATVLKSTGTLLTGDQVYNTSSAMPLSNVTGRYTLLGNPFASAIDWTTLPSTNLSNTYWGWDPNLSSTGGYVTVSATGTATLIAPFSGTVGLNQYIQPGQGFFVKTTGASPTLTIREQDKVGNFNANAFRGGGANSIPLIAINLLYTSGGNTVLADGTLSAFDATFSSSIGKEDASKIAGSAEGISIKNEGETFSIDGRPMPKDNDTLFLNVAKLTKAQYTLQVFTHQLENSNLQFYLEDTYLHTTSPLSLTDTNRITININTADAASASAGRFRIVMKKNIIKPVNIITFTAVKKSKHAVLEWSVSADSSIIKYEVERSVDNVTFFKIGEVAAQATAVTMAYQYLDSTLPAGNVWYRLRMPDYKGTFTLSKAVEVMADIRQSFISVFPNPVINNSFNLQLNEIEQGQYSLSVYNASGQEVKRQALVHGGGTANHLVDLGTLLQQGIYYLQLANEKSRYTYRILKQ